MVSPGRLYPGQLCPPGHLLAAAGSDPLFSSLLLPWSPAGAGDGSGPGDGPGEGHSTAGTTKPGASHVPPPAVQREEALRAETHTAPDVNV